MGSLFNTLSLRLNAFMIAQYPASFPIREFIFERFIIADKTRTKTAYIPIIKILCHLLTLKCLRDDGTGYLYIVGRKRSVSMMKEVLGEMILKTEQEVLNQWKRKQTIEHGSTTKRLLRLTLIMRFEAEIMGIITLKDNEYYEKYATMRKIKSCEIADRIFFTEYIRENRLTHLKPYLSWSATNLRSSKKN